MKYTLVIAMMLFVFKSHAQNLVPNPSFEDSYGCPLSNIYDNNFDNNWYNIFDSPDYFNSCDVMYQGVPSNFWGYQPAIHGNAYTGIGTGLNGSSFEFNGREYIQVRLSEPLKQDSMYCGYFFVNPANENAYSVNDIGMLITDSAFAYGTQLPLFGFDPQIANTPGELLNDTTQWYKICDCFIAEGNEEYLTIGNFKTNSETSYTPIGGPSSGSYYYIDSVALYPVSEDSICDFAVGLSELKPDENKVVVRIIDTMGRETEDKLNTLLIFIYSDGTREKIFRVE
jgi:hypothetical protein